MVAKYALPLFYFLLPFQWALFSSGTHDIALLRVLAAALFIAWVLSAVKRKRFELLRPLPLFFLTGFLALAGLSVYLATHTDAALSKWIFWLNFFPLLLVLYDDLGSAETMKRVLKALVWGAMLSAALGCLQFLSQFVLGVERAYTLWTAPLPFFLGQNFADSVLEYPSFLVNLGGVTVLRASAFFPDPHIYAYFLGMTLPVALLLALEERKKRWVGASVLLLVTLLLTFSRSAYVALLCLAILGFGWGLRRAYYRISPRTILIVGGIIVLLVLSPVSARFFSSFSETDSSVAERARLATEALGHVTERPWLGVGLGNYPFFVKPTASPREPIYVHDMYLDMTVEMGFLGLFFFLGLVIVSSRGPAKSWEETAALGALSFFLIQSLFENPLFSVQILPLFLLFLAIRLQWQHE